MAIIKTAIIIKGNPKLVNGNISADIFYNELKSFLESLDYDVSFDPGEPYTSPPPAGLWIGHSRGSDRLRFAPKETIVIGLGVPESVEGNSFPVVNHPEDQLAHRIYKEGKIIKNEDTDVTLDDTYHYILTEEMKSEIIKILKSAVGHRDPTAP